ncbi:MAG: LysR family transcriptional regulator [Rhodoferax sp.]|nr:LysR family transcriptional regulator [Rhodoferax sp.]
MEIFRNMHLFVEVARASSFRRAAEVLGLPNSTVSRRIAELERAVGLRLFNRSTRRVELTEGGRLYFNNCQRIIQEAELANQELTDLQTQPSGVIRASLPVDFSVIYLSPLLADFSRRYPGIRFDLDLTPNRADLMGDPVDVAIRMGPPQDQNLIARPIARLATVLVAAPDYLQRRGMPARPQDLAGHDCLRMKEAPWVLVHRDGSSQSVEVGGQFVANSRGLLQQLALGGQGIVQSAESWVQADLAAGRLERVLPDWSPPVVGAYALTATRLLPAKVRVFIDYLVANMAEPSHPLKG